jgi:hypothetical protein
LPKKVLVGVPAIGVQNVLYPARMPHGGHQLLLDDFAVLDAS